MVRRPATVASRAPVSAPSSAAASVPCMTEVLIATDADAVFAEVEAALVDETTTVVR